MTKKQRVVIVNAAMDCLTAMDDINRLDTDKAMFVLLQTVKALQNLAREAE